jgi:hypothetical protein
MKKIFLIIFFFIISTNVNSTTFEMSDCDISSGRVKTILQNNTEYKQFILNNKDMGCWSGDKRPRHDAPYWERIEYAQRETLLKNKRHVIEFNIKIEEGFKGERETFFQIHNYTNSNFSIYPSLMLKFDQGMFRADFLRNNNSHVYEHVKKVAKFRDVENYYNKFINFRIILSNLNDENSFGLITIFINGDKIFSEYPTFFPSDGTPRIKYGIYRPGNESGNNTSKILYSSIEVTSK